MNENRLLNIVLTLLLVLTAVVSIFLLSDSVSTEEAHEQSLTSINQKVDTVLKLTAATTLASAGVSAIPGDTATPIADKLADFTEYFLMILCVLYAEKYLLSIVGVATFKILIPLACLGLIIFLYSKNPKAKNISAKLAVFGIALFFMIPLSLKVSDMIYDSYQEKIENTLDNADSFNEKTNELSQADENEGLIQSILNSLKETATSLADKAADLLNRFIESLAVMIVTSCVIPLLVLIFFLWLIRTLTGKEIVIPTINPFRKRKKPDMDVHEKDES